MGAQDAVTSTVNITGLIEPMVPIEAFTLSSSPEQLFNSSQVQFGHSRMADI